MRPAAPLLALAFGVAAVACSGGGGGGRDHGQPSTSYPAPHAAFPSVLNHGGPVLSAPKLVSITYDADPYRAQLDDYVSRVGTSSWWMAVTSGYGVGPVVATTSVHLSEAAPQYITRTDMEAWLASHLDGSDPAWPLPDDQTLYLLFYPPGTVVDDPGSGGLGQSCQYWYAYHFTLSSASGRVWYAVMPECPNYGQDSELDVQTTDSSHEIIEAATDPDAFAPAWTGVSDDFIAFGNGEVGDLCVNSQYADYEPADLPYKVQRIFSNVAAAAGRDPCSPEIFPFFGAPPANLEFVQFDFGPGNTIGTKGVQVKKGETKTIELDFFSDQRIPTIHLQATELFAQFGQPPELEVSIDKPDGLNGEKAYLTLKGLGSSGGPLDVVTITADSGGFTHSWPLWVQTQ